jgi:hypothetical protein
MTSGGDARTVASAPSTAKTTPARVRDRMAVTVVIAEPFFPLESLTGVTEGGHEVITYPERR